MKPLIVVLAVATISLRGDPASGAQDTLEAWRLSNEPTVVIGGADEREATLKTRRPAEEPVVAAGEADEPKDQVLHGDDDNPGSQDRFQRWSLSEEPSVVIGGADEREGYLLHQVAGATRFGDGRIVVANGGSLELRYYDPEGRHLLSAGGAGEGPGELKPPLDHFTRLHGDSILVASWRSGFIRFGPDGRYASSIPYELPPRGRCWQFVGNDLLPDGSLLLRYTGTSRFTDTDEPCPKLGEGRPLTVIGRYIPGSSGSIDTIAALPGFEWTGDRNRMHAYAKDMVLAMALNRLYLGYTGSDSIFVMSFQGDTIGTLPVPVEPAPVPSEAREKASEETTGMSRDPISMEPLTRTERRTFIYPDHYPRYARLVAAPEDRVWVMAFPPLKEPAFPQELTDPMFAYRLDRGASWRVVGQDGVVAELETPPGFFLIEVGDDHVLGVHRDELHRESVRLHRLIR